MNRQEWTYPERRRRLVDGPWNEEPDKVQWVDDETNLDCLIVRSHGGHLCGYVGVPPGHPWYDVDYGNIEPHPRIHGGLTYSNRCLEDEAEPTICHVPLPGRPDNVWWIGFDCAHVGDLSPRLLDPNHMWSHETYKDVAYVEREVTDLARQVKAAA